PNEPPVVRVDGRLQKLEGYPAVPPAESKRIIYSILNPRQVAQFEKFGDVDMPLSIPGINSRFRVNVFLQQKGVACALRPLSVAIPPPEQIGLSDTIVRMAELPRGLDLVVGPTGSGKTTTMASLIQHINSRHKKHI